MTIKIKLTKEEHVDFIRRLRDAKKSVAVLLRGDGEKPERSAAYAIFDEMIKMIGVKEPPYEDYAECCTWKTDDELAQAVCDEWKFWQQTGDTADFDAAETEALKRGLVIRVHKGVGFIEVLDEMGDILADYVFEPEDEEVE